MRKNTSEVFTAWANGKANRRHKAISTDGNTIYSYATPILWRENGQPRMNEEKHSKTTSTQQNQIRGMLAKN